MRLIVGLGNPGKKYENTRHNVGFEVVCELLRRYQPGRPKTKFQGEYYETRLGGESAMLLMPHTFMNLSGGSVLAARDFYKIDNADILVICDDLNLKIGRLRFRPKGSAGGQNGLADILRRLGSQDIQRLRVGIGKVPTEWDAADFVLSRFDDEQRDLMDQGVVKAANGVEDWVRDGIAECMNRYNADHEEAARKKQLREKKRLEKAQRDKERRAQEEKAKESPQGGADAGPPNE